MTETPIQIVESAFVVWARLLDAVVEVSEVTIEEMYGPGRSARVAQARHVALYLGREHTSLTLTDLARSMGNRDHTTVSYAITKVLGKIQEHDPSTTALVAAVEKIIRAPRPKTPSIKVFDPGDSNPGVVVTYERPDGSRWQTILIMNRVKGT